LSIVYFWSLADKRVQDQLAAFRRIYSTECAFAAVKNDGSALTWVLAELIGDSGRPQEQLADIQLIYSTKYAFVAVKMLVLRHAVVSSGIVCTLRMLMLPHAIGPNVVTYTLKLPVLRRT